MRFRASCPKTSSGLHSTARACGLPPSVTTAASSGSTTRTPTSASTSRRPIDPRGEWSTPTLVLPGKGLIDPCPLWDDDGTVWLVHAWARSRAGFNNVITLRRLTPDGLTAADDGGVVIVDGNALPGYRTLEGPKLYKRGGEYLLFAPAGGVATGWQSVFRARDIRGPYRERIVLDQGRSAVNGPHQGAWVDTPQGEDWYLHFQDKGPYGRVVHLEPMTWSEDGWPIIGWDPDGNGGASR